MIRVGPAITLIFIDFTLGPGGLSRSLSPKDFCLSSGLFPNDSRYKPGSRDESSSIHNVRVFMSIYDSLFIPSVSPSSSRVSEEACSLDLRG